MAVTSVVTRDTGGPAQWPLAFARIWLVSGAVDFASTAAGAVNAHDATVSGVALGDMVLGVSLGVDNVDADICATVTAANTVTVVLSNNTAGAVDLAATTVKFVIGRPAF